MSEAVGVTWVQTTDWLCPCVPFLPWCQHMGDATLPEVSVSSLAPVRILDWLAVVNCFRVSEKIIVRAFSKSACSKLTLYKLLFPPYMSIMLFVAKTTDYHLRVFCCNKSILSPMLHLLRFFFFLILSKRLCFILGEGWGIYGKTEKCTPNVLGVTKCSSFLLCNLEKSKLSSKSLKAFIYWIVFVLWIRLFPWSGERKETHRTLYDSHQVTGHCRFWACWRNSIFH